jgi:DeoR/GlpR family transcriptional regulator of sugar metabolism
MSDGDMPRGHPRTATNEEIMHVLKADDNIVFGAQDVADHFSVSAQTARNRMAEMAEQNLLKRRKIGTTWVYWIDCKR